MMKSKMIELYSNDSQIMKDAIDRIVVEIYNRKHKTEDAHTLLLTGCGPRCGTTSTCIGLGIAFANAKWKTLIIDCDIRKAYKYKKLNQGTDVGLADYLIEEKSANIENVEDVVYSTNIENLSYISCGQYSESPARLFCSNNMPKVMEYAKKNFDYIILDFPSITVVPDAQILFGETDGIILLSALGVATKKQVKEAKQKIKAFEDKYYGMIVNKIDIDLYKKYIKKYDYYFIDENGDQKLEKKAKKDYDKKRKIAERGIYDDER